VPSSACGAGTGWRGSEPHPATTRHSANIAARNSTQREVGVTVGPDIHDEAPGRDWSLRGAIAEAKLTVPVHGTPDHDAAEAALHDTGTSEEAVFFESEGGSLIVYIRYISDGFAANASSELAVELRAAGYTVTEV
jgi:hypothetical protein